MFFNASDNFVGNNLQNIESNSLGNGSALSSNNNISFSYVESGRDVNGDISVTLFISVVFGCEMHIISTDNNSSVHFGRNHESLDDSSSNGNVAGERAFLIDIMTFAGFFGGLESQTDVFPVSDSLGGLFS